jgi:hypothetical protein
MVPLATALGITGVNMNRSLHEFVAYGEARVKWLETQIYDRISWLASQAAVVPGMASRLDMLEARLAARGSAELSRIDLGVGYSIPS